MSKYFRWFDEKKGIPLEKNEKIEDVYYCKKCKHMHYLYSGIGQMHGRYGGWKQV